MVKSSPGVALEPLFGPNLDSTVNPHLPAPDRVGGGVPLEGCFCSVRVGCGVSRGYTYPIHDELTDGIPEIWIVAGAGVSTDLG